MFNSIKPNTVVRIDSDNIGVVEGEDIYQVGLLNIYNKTTERKFKKSEVQILSLDYVDSKLWPYQIFNAIK